MGIRANGYTCYPVVSALWPADVR